MVLLQASLSVDDLKYENEKSITKQITQHLLTRCGTSVSACLPDQSETIAGEYSNNSNQCNGRNNCRGCISERSDACGDQEPAVRIP